MRGKKRLREACKLYTAFYKLEVREGTRTIGPLDYQSAYLTSMPHYLHYRIYFLSRHVGCYLYFEFQNVLKEVLTSNNFKKNDNTFDFKIRQVSIVPRSSTVGSKVTADLNL